MSPTLRRSPVCILLAALWLGTGQSAGAAPPPPAEELLRFVPADVTFCFVLRDLRGHAAALGTSPLAERLRDSLAPALKGTPELQQWEKAKAFIEKLLGLSPERLRDDILGDSVVLAYRAGPPGKPQQEQGLLLVRAREAKTLAALVDRVNEVHKQSGELKKLEEREHNGVKYFRRIERKDENFYCVRGPVLLFSGQESILREALTLEKKLPADKEAPVARQLRLLRADRSLVSVWLNPRAFDAVFEAKLGKAAGSEAAFLKTFVACWKAVESVAFTVALTTDLEMGLTVRAKPEALPAAVRGFFDEAASRSEVWSRIPDNALLAVGARTDLSALLGLIGAFQTKEGFEALKENLNRGLGATLGGSVATEVLPNVGPDWGLYVTAPPRDQKQWMPASVFAIRVSAGNADAPVDRALVDALRSWAVLAAWNNLKKKDILRLRTMKQDKNEIHYLASERGQTMGLQPAFGLSGGYLILASSPEAFRRYVSATPSPAAAGEVPLLRLSLKDVRQYLLDRRDVLVSTLAEQHKLEPKEVGRNFDYVVAGLRFFERLELVQKTSPGQATLTLRLRTSLPLRK
jgi:hypothetical protein